jgi:hypothetical protein
MTERGQAPSYSAWQQSHRVRGGAVRQSSALVKRISTLSPWSEESDG